MKKNKTTRNAKLGKCGQCEEGITIVGILLLAKQRKQINWIDA